MSLDSAPLNANTASLIAPLSVELKDLKESKQKRDDDKSLTA